MARPRKEVAPAEFKPVVSEMLAPALPAEVQPIPVQSEGRKVYNVSLDALPAMEIEADSHGEAISIYNGHMGIISTEHAYKVI